jgi:hypothetical protein
MRGVHHLPLHVSSLPVLASSVLPSLILFAGDAHAAPSLVGRNNNPLNIDWDPAPPPEKGPPESANAVRDPAYLPAQIGGIVGSYAVCLALVAVILVLLSKKRREALNNGDHEAEFEEQKPRPEEELAQERELQPISPRSQPKSPVRNFSYPSPDRETSPYVFPSPISTTLGAPGIDRAVDQRVVAADRNMAQQQLEDIYKYVMEQEEAKANGIVLEYPPTPMGGPSHQRPSISSTSSSKKEKNKPAKLILGGGQDKEKTHSRTSSILSALRSPRKKGIKGISISSPIMTPMSGTFPSPEAREMSTIPPRQYAPAAPPPVPMDQAQAPFGASRNPGNGTPITPDYSPESTLSIDERIGHQLPYGHSRNASAAPTIEDPLSAVTDTSTTPLVGLPSSPKPGVSRFPSLPSLPSSPKPGSTFSRANPPSAIRTGGALPLRAYDPQSPSESSSQHTKQTVFERMGPLSPMSARTPFTGAAVPYSPYQPFSPCIPMTPSLVTKADRKRMKRMEPKTPTLQMVRASDDVW